VPDQPSVCAGLIINVDELSEPVAGGGLTKLSAALTGHTWLLSIAQSRVEHPGNLTCRLFDLNYFESLGDGDNVTSEDLDSMKLTRKIKDLVLDEDMTVLQLRFRQCIQIGYEIPDCYAGFMSSSGCLICDPDDYADFWPFFAQVLQEIHGEAVVATADEQPVVHTTGGSQTAGRFQS
jgi:hypothetical protein